MHKLQKRETRIILDPDTKERSAKLFKALNWFPLQDEIKAQKDCTRESTGNPIVIWNSSLLEMWTNTIDPTHIPS